MWMDSFTVDGATSFATVMEHASIRTIIFQGKLLKPMHCCKCNNEITECTCPDLKERLESLKSCEHLHIGADYLARIEKQAENNSNKKTVEE
jgi:hypothetical protein